ncbi:hypothetical protein ABPG74_015302 [Tetrahymena malaccensis]
MVDSDTEQINNLVQAIQDCEKTQENIEWVYTITEKDYDLINLFIIAFMEQFEDIQKANSILIALKKLNEFAPDQVLPQMRENEKFPIAISQYIIKTQKLEDLVGEAFLLLIDIFQVSSFKSVTNQAFIERLFDMLQIINDEETFHAIIKIFINISYEYKNPKENLVIKVASSHQYSRYFSETIIKFLNKNEDDLIIKTLQFIEDIYIVQSDFFYSHDFNVLIDVCIREINNTNKENIREKYIEVLHVLTDTDQYKKKQPRRDSIFRLVETMQYATVSAKSKSISNELKVTLDKI